MHWKLTLKVQILALFNDRPVVNNYAYLMIAIISSNYHNYWSKIQLILTKLISDDKIYINWRRYLMNAPLSLLFCFRWPIISCLSNALRFLLAVKKAKGLKIKGKDGKFQLHHITQIVRPYLQFAVRGRGRKPEINNTEI